MLRPNDRIGPFQLVRHLGTGTFKTVWLAERVSNFARINVALGIPIQDVDTIQLKREAALWIQASGHPNVLPVQEVEVYDGYVCIVSEYAEDGTMSQWLQNNGGKAPDLRSALDMTIGVLNGLEHLHSQNPPIIHRDLKPANILLQRNSPRITDFGLARLVDSQGTSVVGGTPVFMSPECFEADYSIQSDIWAMGVILYLALTGVFPFGSPGMNMVQLSRCIERFAPHLLPDTIPEKVCDVVLKALEKDPAERFQSAAEMRNALQEAMAQPVAIIRVQGTATFLFTDIVNSSGLKQAMPGVTQAQKDSAYYQQIKRPHDNRLLPLITRNDGHLVKDTGDGLFAVFSDAEDATLCAVEMQHTLTNAPIATPEGMLKIKIGLNTGRVEIQNNDYIGAAVDKAARIQGEAGGGEVLLSHTTYALAQGLGDVHFSSARMVNLRGIGKEQVYRVLRNPPLIIVNPIDGSEMILIPAGVFMMGSSEDQFHYQPELPQRAVFLDAYRISKYPVTVAQYRKYTEETRTEYDWNGLNPPWGWIDDHPMVNVGWKEARAYCQWAGGDLPTEAQWEKAARGTDGRTYPWGNERDGGKHYASSVSPNKQYRTVKVGSYPSRVSPYGVHDMAGNVWEWCLDYYDGDYYKVAPKNNPVNLKNGNSRVVRGGISAGRFRSAYRDGSDGGRDDLQGFRVVSEL